MTVFGIPIDWELPTILNSNLFPVNANGDVLFLSVLSNGIFGNESTPSAIWGDYCRSTGEFMQDLEKPLSRSINFSNGAPTNTDIIVGGASFFPSLFSLAGYDADSLRRSWYLSTAAMTAKKNSIKRLFCSRVEPGYNRLTPVSVPKLQLLCFPLPLRPYNGYSCSRHYSPCFIATLFIVSITI